MARAPGWSEVGVGSSASASSGGTWVPWRARSAAASSVTAGCRSVAASGPASSGRAARRAPARARPSRRRCLRRRRGASGSAPSTAAAAASSASRRRREWIAPVDRMTTSPAVHTSLVTLSTGTTARSGVGERAPRPGPARGAQLGQPWSTSHGASATTRRASPLGERLRRPGETASANAGQHVLRPVVEVAVGEGDAGDTGVGVDPEERARRRRSGRRWPASSRSPVQCGGLVVADLEARGPSRTGPCCPNPGTSPARPGNCTVVASARVAGIDEGRVAAAPPRGAGRRRAVPWPRRPATRRPARSPPCRADRARPRAR